MTLCLDRDEPGAPPTARAVEQAARAGRSPRSSWSTPNALAPAKDPDAFVREQGVEALAEPSSHANCGIDLAGAANSSPAYGPDSDRRRATRGARAGGRVARHAAASARTRAGGRDNDSLRALWLLRGSCPACFSGALLDASVARTRLRPGGRPVNAPLLSPEDVSALCGLSRKAVYRAIERGELQAFRLCSRLRIHPDDVECWLAANQVGFTQRQAAPAARAPDRLPTPGGLRRLMPSS